jgi:transposase
MHDTQLYQQLLGLAEPWTVTRVELSVADARVDVWVDHPPRRRFACPECGCELFVREHADERVWRHLDSCQFLTYLHARPPRVDCLEHGIRQVRLPWAEPMSRFTILFERLAIDVLRECDVQGAARLGRISWDEAWHLMDRAVRRGLAAKTPRVPAYVGCTRRPPAGVRTTSPWSATWTPPRSRTSPTSAARPAWTATSPGSPQPSVSRSRR